MRAFLSAAGLCFIGCVMVGLMIFTSRGEVQRSTSHALVSILSTLFSLVVFFVVMACCVRFCTSSTQTVVPVRPVRPKSSLPTTPASVSAELVVMNDNNRAIAPDDDVFAPSLPRDISNWATTKLASLCEVTFSSRCKCRPFFVILHCVCVCVCVQDKDTDGRSVEEAWEPSSEPVSLLRNMSRESRYDIRITVLIYMVWSWQFYASMSQWLTDCCYRHDVDDTCCNWCAFSCKTLWCPCCTYADITKKLDTDVRKLRFLFVVCYLSIYFLWFD